VSLERRRRLFGAVLCCPLGFARDDELSEALKGGLVLLNYLVEVSVAP
jgi:hypothetical protein